MPFLRDLERFLTELVDCRKDLLKAYKLVQATKTSFKEPSDLEKKLKAENLNDSKNQTLCNQMEELIKTGWELRRNETTKLFVNLSDSRSYYLDLSKLFGRSNDCGNKTALVASTSAGEKDPNETVIDTEIEAIENTGENVEVSSWQSATHGSRKEPSIANSRPSRRRRIDEMELENLRAKKETKQRLREQQMELEQKREEIELRRRKEQ